MKLIYFILFSAPFLFLRCAEVEKSDLEMDSFFEVGERIDGPANIRTKADKDLLFELNDNAIVQVGKKRGDWLSIGVFLSLYDTQEASGFVEAGTVLYNVYGETIGKTFDRIPLVMVNDEKKLGYIQGITHIDNIKPESFIENDLVSHLDVFGRNMDDFQDFILKYRLEEEDRFLDYEGYFIYENMTVDPSPGFRILLLFIEGDLKGIFHSRDLSLKNCSTYELMDDYKVSFFNDYSKEAQEEFVIFMKGWLQGVD